MRSSDFLIALALILAAGVGCTDEASEPPLNAAQHDHYHVHAVDVEHDHDHGGDQRGGHDHDHVHPEAGGRP